MKKRSLLLGLGLLLAMLPAIKMNAQSEVEPLALATKNLSKYNAINQTISVDTRSTMSPSTSLLEEPGKMVLYFSEEILTLSYVNSDKEVVEFTIREESGDVIYKKGFGKTVMVHNRVVTTELPSGEYIATFRSGNDYYEKSFEIEK